MNLEEFGLHAGVSLDGIKVAQVVSNADPKCQERVLVRVIGVHNMEVDTYSNAVWSHHCSPFRDASGELPEKYDYVYVMFPDRKDPMHIIWLGFVRSSYQEGDNAAISKGDLNLPAGPMLTELDIASNDLTEVDEQ